MARKQRCRQISSYPDYWEFSPEESESDLTIFMTLDEFETIRLLDREGLTQEQCAERMGVARTTVTAIYESARRKIAETLVDGRRLRIGGGHYQLCDQGAGHIQPKEADCLRLAIPYDGGMIFPHFGRTAQFKLYDLKDQTVVRAQLADTGGAGHGALAGFLKAANADVLICGGIGMGAQNALAEAGVRLCAGVSGAADAAAEAFADGTLRYDAETICARHEHAHGEEHPCGYRDRCRYDTGGDNL
ncbi:MAG: DUF134 domain-containing protein [Oscillospiraceae bacterium]|nr:DUF134 domain-containing protein [Oscillospiraceae bacterium]